MTTVQDVVIVDIFKEIIDSMVVPDVAPINYSPGRIKQILKSLNVLDNSITYKGDKYPLFALFMPIREDRTGPFYCKAKIDRIVIAAITTEEKIVTERYNADETFKTILYPVYNEFLRRLAWSRWTNIGDPYAFAHTKRDNPGTQPLGEGVTDYVDMIEILNLEVIFNQIKTC